MQGHTVGQGASATGPAAGLRAAARDHDVSAGRRDARSLEAEENSPAAGAASRAGTASRRGSRYAGGGAFGRGVTPCRSSGCWLGSARLARSARLGSARLGSARLGSARLGSARLGSARLGSARLGSARLGSARLGSARLGSARLGSARLGSARNSRIKTLVGCQVFFHAVPNLSAVVPSPASTAASAGGGHGAAGALSGALLSRRFRKNRMSGPGMAVPACRRESARAGAWAGSEGFNRAEQERGPQRPAHGAPNQRGLGVSPRADRRSRALLHALFSLPIGP